VLGVHLGGDQPGPGEREPVHVHVPRGVGAVPDVDVRVHRGVGAVEDDGGRLRDAVVGLQRAAAGGDAGAVHLRVAPGGGAVEVVALKVAEVLPVEGHLVDVDGQVPADQVERDDRARDGDVGGGEGVEDVVAVEVAVAVGAAELDRRAGVEEGRVDRL